MEDRIGHHTPNALSQNKMPIFTARENFNLELIKGCRSCQSCNRSISGETALVNRWKNKKGEQSLIVCNEICWSNYDHNYWLERAADREYEAGHLPEAYELLDARLPKYGEQINVS